ECHALPPGVRRVADPDRPHEGRSARLVRVSPSCRRTHPRRAPDQPGIGGPAHTGPSGARPYRTRRIPRPSRGGLKGAPDVSGPRSWLSFRHNPRLAGRIPGSDTAEVRDALLRQRRRHPRGLAPPNHGQVRLPKLSAPLSLHEQPAAPCAKISLTHRWGQLGDFLCGWWYSGSFSRRLTSSRRVADGRRIRPAPTSSSLSTASSAERSRRCPGTESTGRLTSTSDAARTRSPTLLL